MLNLFYAFWWLLLPIGGLLFAGYQSWLKYRQQKAVLDLIKTYADRGEQPPEALVSRLDLTPPTSQDWNAPSSGPKSAAHYWSLVGLFGMMAVGFGIGAAMGVDGNSGAFVIVALVMAAVGVWSAINALFLSRPRD